jgi:hypothetical protein
MQPQSIGPLLGQLAGRGGPGFGGPPPDVPGQPDSDEQAPIAILKQMITLGAKYIAVENDAADKATMAKLVATLHQYLAKDQQDAEAALGGGAATRALRKLG